MSGYTENWTLRRQPIRLALRLFYGERSANQLPESQLLEHPELFGDWKWIESGGDHILLWLGTRSIDGRSDRRDPVHED
jgi:hypothetical protein